MVSGVLTVTMTDNNTIRLHKHITWEPAPDITALEVAKALPLLISMAHSPLKYWEDFIPTELLRHFKIEDQS